MDNKDKTRLIVVGAILLLVYGGGMNSIFMGALESSDISCTTDTECDICIGNQLFNETQEINSGYCNMATNTCIISEWCVNQGAVTDWVKQHPWAWIKQNPILALVIIIGTIYILFFYK